MDPNATDIGSLKANAVSTANDANKVATDIPGMMAGLKTNLSSIFSKDNPMFADRENALQTFLNAPSQTRAGMLPENQPIIGGSHLNFSPTQQDAQVTAARNAALVPLAGLNSSIVGQSGNLNDILGNAANIFNTQAKGAQDRAASALDLYRAAISELSARNSGSGVTGGDLMSFLSQQNQNNTQSQADLEAKYKAILDHIDQTSGSGAQPPTFTGSQPLSNLFGDSSTTLPGGQVIQHIGPGGQSIAPSGLDMGNVPVNLFNPNSTNLSLAGGGSNAFGLGSKTGLQFQL